MKKPRKRNKEADYVNNKVLYQAIVEWKELDDEKAEMPEIVGIAILKIAQHLGKRKNFSNYTFLEEMIGDAIENCVKYWRNFNHEKYKNPHAYFTQICWSAFLQRLSKEKKELANRENMISDPQVIQQVIDVLDADSRQYLLSSLSEQQNKFVRAREEDKKLAKRVEDEENKYE